MLTIRNARINRGLSQADLADRVGVSVASVSEAEERDARGAITLANRAKYLAAMGLSDAVVTVKADASAIASLWDDTMDGAAEIQESMAFEGQPVSAEDTEQLAVHSFASRLGARG